ncbi:Uncharacterised protein [Salmonella enterica]|nr:Uncharacterised protein [Salmonella enterica]
MCKYIRLQGIGGTLISVNASNNLHMENSLYQLCCTCRYFLSDNILSNRKYIMWCRVFSVFGYHLIERYTRRNTLSYARICTFA